MKKTSAKAVFTQVSSNEVRIDYKGFKFLLIEKSRGVYGLGKAVQLYQLEGLKKTHIKEVGWTKSDNHSCTGIKNAIINEITTMKQCERESLKYIDSLL
jgi:hypothetical protein